MHVYKVRVIGCSRPTLWYSLRVGSVFYVESCSEALQWRLIDVDGEFDNARFFYDEDLVTIEAFTCDRIVYGDNRFYKFVNDSREKKPGTIPDEATVDHMLNIAVAALAGKPVQYRKKGNPDNMWWEYHKGKLDFDVCEYRLKEDTADLKAENIRLKQENELYRAEMSEAKADGFYSASELYDAYKNLSGKVAGLKKYFNEKCK